MDRFPKNVAHGALLGRLVRLSSAYGGGTREFEWYFKRFKEGIKERKLFLEHQQTVAPNPREHQVVRGLFGCPYINV